MLLEFRVGRDFLQLTGKDSNDLPRKPRIYTGLKTSVWFGHAEEGERHLKQRQKRYRTGPENRDHCIFILMSGPWGELERRSRPDYKELQTDFIRQTGRQLLLRTYLCFTEITELYVQDWLKVWSTELKQTSRREMFKVSTKITAVGMIGEDEKTS